MVGVAARFRRMSLGRRVALLVLAGVLVCQGLAPGVFKTPRVAQFDLFQSLMPRRPSLDHVVVVGIGDDALKAEGAWPWSRDRQAALIDRILSTHPKLVAFDGFWTGGPDPADHALIRTLSSGTVISGIQGVSGGPPIDYEGPLTPVLTPGGDGAVARLPAFRSGLGSKETIDVATSGRGVLSAAPDDDEVYRRYSLLSTINGRLAPALGLEAYRLAAGAQLVTLIQQGGKLVGVAAGDTTIPVEPDGSFAIDYAPRDLVKVCSAETIVPGRGCRLLGSKAIEPLDGRLVLIGITAPTAQDQDRRTPLGGPSGVMPGVEIQAQALENLISGQLVRRVPFAAICEPALAFAAGLVLILAFPRAVSWRAASFVAVGAVLSAAGAVLWRELRVLIDVATPVLGCAAVTVSMLGGDLVEAERQRRRLRRELEVQRLVTARAEGEMEAARLIQLGILPKPESLGDDPRLDLDALMVAARQIGGDLYDFFKIDPDHLFIAVGDVSGKGLPASLFMALGKALCKSCALRGESDIGAIVRRANEEISRDNPEMLFITLFAGILDLRTGELRFCNAGHDAPFLLRDGEPPMSVKSIGGPPLCVTDDFPYATETSQLSRGDLLCLMTDGVTEAMTASGELMGRERVAGELASVAAGTSAREVARGLQAAVGRFVDGAEPSDDLTILAVRWSGPDAGGGSAAISA